jgi:thiol-disulfide isomerase/thioredoxin
MGGCNKKDTKENPFAHISDNQPVQPLTKELLQAANPAGEDNDTDLDIDTEESPEKNASFAVPPEQNTFDLIDITQQHKHITLKESAFTSNDISEPITLFYFFSPWSLPCQGEVPYLSDLQKRYDNKLLVVGVLLNPKKYADTLGTFIQTYHANFFIAAGRENNRFAQALTKPLHLPDMMPIPLIVIYHNGHYWRHYEGAVPVEMLEHDIKTILTP